MGACGKGFSTYVNTSRSAFDLCLSVELLAPVFLQSCDKPSREPARSLSVLPSIPALDPAGLIPYG